MKKLIRITLLEEALGTKAADPEVFGTYIASKKPDGHPDKAELETAESMEQSGTSIFHRQPVPRLIEAAKEKKKLAILLCKEAGTNTRKVLLEPDLHKQKLGELIGNQTLTPVLVEAGFDEHTPLTQVVQWAQTAMVLAHRNGTPFIYDYQIRGFFKDACGALRRADGTLDGGDENLSKKLAAHKSVIDGCVFVGPREIPLNVPEDLEEDVCERPLRAETPQGPRVALARSETVPAGTTLDIEISLTKADLWPTVKQWLDYGQLRGLGQWRNSGKGRFTWMEL